MLRAICKRGHKLRGAGGAGGPVMKQAWTSGKYLPECHAEGHGLERQGQGIYHLHS